LGGEKKKGKVMNIAFKEWAVICEALARGTQSLIVRKGGIAEVGGAFRPEHQRFWLYPTYVHQQDTGIRESARALLEQSRSQRPADDRLRITHFADVTSVHHLTNLHKVLSLAEFHCWSEETIRMRFHYREPGLYLLVTRVYQAATPHEILLKSEYEGCKTWVQFDTDISTDGAKPVMNDEDFSTLCDRLAKLHCLDEPEA
jgi:hypothetical protein